MEREEFDNLAAKYGAFVLNAALRLVRDENTAGDVQQEVFLAIWRQKRGRCVTDWKAYLYRTTIRKAMEQIRKMKTFPTSSVPYDHPACGDANRPENRLIASETRRHLARCISELPDKQAQAFTLLRIEGLSYPQAAEIMDCRQETVRVHLHRGLKQLAALMLPYLEKGAQL